MSRTIQRTRTSGSLAATALLLAALLGAGSAQASTVSPAESISGDFSYPPFTLQVSAQRAAGAPADAATGSFTGTLSIGSTKVGDFMGPVTCLDVEGNSAGLFYPVTSSDPSVIAAVPFGVLVTVTRTSTGQPLGVTFLPVPGTQVSSCAPMASTLFPITSGTLTFTPGIPSSAPSTPMATTLAITNNVRFGRRGTKHANLLAAAGGDTVYTLSGETPRHPKCTKANRCLRIWHPITLGATGNPTKPSNVTGRLGVWSRQGLRQVTLNGHPLYTFAGDTTPGVATGASIHSFAGTWNVIRTPAALTPPTATTSPPPPAPPPALY
jgi:predicted lipoprotein with Yx(FWY)xxD motif